MKKYTYCWKIEIEANNEIEAEDILWKNYILELRISHEIAQIILENFSLITKPTQCEGQKNEI